MFQQQKADSSRLLGAIFQWDHPGCACPAWLEGIVLCTTKGTMTTHLHHQKAMTMKQPSTYRDWQAAVEESNVIYNVAGLGYSIVGLANWPTLPGQQQSSCISVIQPKQFSRESPKIRLSSGYLFMEAEWFLPILQNCRAKGLRRLKNWVSLNYGNKIFGSKIKLLGKNWMQSNIWF